MPVVVRNFENFAWDCIDPTIDGEGLRNSLFK